jgi:hypothetical protein
LRRSSIEGRLQGSRCFDMAQFQSAIPLTKRADARL